MLRRRTGFFRDAREPLPERVAALRALVALGCPEGQEAIDQILAAEPAGPERETLQQALTEAQRQPLA